MPRPASPYSPLRPSSLLPAPPAGAGTFTLWPCPVFNLALICGVIASTLRASPRQGQAHLRLAWPGVAWLPRESEGALETAVCPRLQPSPLRRSQCAVSSLQLVVGRHPVLKKIHFY